MQPFQCDLQAQIPKHPRTTHTQAQPKQLEATVTMRHQKKSDRSRTRRTDEVPFIAACSHFTRENIEKHKVSCSGFLPKTKPMQNSCSHYTMHFAAFPSSPLPFVTTSLRHHFPSSPLPFLTTSLRHHFPSSPRPFLTTSLRHNFPSSPLPLVTTPQRHHSLRHHFPKATTLP